MKAMVMNCCMILTNIELFQFKSTLAVGEAKNDYLLSLSFILFFSKYNK
jgi:hypothetical protein